MLQRQPFCGLAIIIFRAVFSDTCGLIFAVISFQEIKTDKKYKHLWNFPAVTLQALL
jgi:hypothetical protein